MGALQQGQDPLAAAETYAALNPTLAGPVLVDVSHRGVRLDVAVATCHPLSPWK